MKFNILEKLAAMIILLFLFFPWLVIALLIKIDSKGPVIIWSRRVGINKKIFNMPKLRTMQTTTPQKASHLLDDPGKYITRVGKFLRVSSLDETPQLISVLKGDMSFIGPRPALFNQTDLISLRDKYGIYNMKPGITGWAQVNGRDNVSINEKVDLEYFHLLNRSILMDMKIIFKTFFRLFNDKNISH